MTTVSPPSAIALELAKQFSVFGPTFRRWMHAQLGDHETTYARIRLLHVLRCSNEPQIMSALSELLGVTPRNVTALVDALESEELVRRRPHPTDRRATLVELTTSGANMCGQRWDAHQCVVAGLFDELTADDQATLLRIMGELTEALQRRGAELPDPR